jgi:hypothetical protein
MPSGDISSSARKRCSPKTNASPVSRSALIYLHQDVVKSREALVLALDAYKKAISRYRDAMGLGFPKSR